MSGVVIIPYKTEKEDLLHTVRRGKARTLTNHQAFGGYRHKL
jgi:hypothetical protein